MNMSPKHNDPKKGIGNFEFFVKPFAIGDRSEICLAWNKGSTNVEYIVKCIKVVEANKMLELIQKEIANAVLYKSTNILIKYVDVEQSANNLYLFYYYVGSQSLSQLLDSGNQELSIERKMIIAKNIAKSIYSLHQAKLIHRNLHPGHILISQSNSIIFCGVKSIFDMRNKLPVDSIGTPYYKAPEIEKSTLCGENYNEKVDVYSFGVILLKIFSGKLFKFNIFYDEVINNTEIIPSVKDLIIQCLKANPNERISSDHISDEKYYDINIKMTPYKILEKKDLSSYNWEKSVLIGEGAFSSVYQILNNNEMTECAIKVFKMEEINTKQKVKELVIQEIDLLYWLRDLRFVTHLYEAFYYNSQLYMAIELCNGGNLNSHVINLSKKNAFLNIDDIRLIGWSIAEGINELHSRNIVHRDLKPENILLAKDENKSIIGAKICDLGLGKKLKDNYPEFFTICGSKAYWAPEIFQREYGIDVHLTKSVDVFSYGLILFFLIFGHHACEKNGKKFYYGLIDVPEEKRIPKELLELVRQCVKQKPEERISFEKIIKNPFFIPKITSTFPSTYLFDLNGPNSKESTNSKGILDKTGKYWIKIYKEQIYNNNKIQKYFMREVDFLFKSKLIPHINQVRDYGFYEKTFALSYEYCNGGNLNDQMNFRLRNKTNNSPGKPIFTLSEIKCFQKCFIEFIDDMHGFNYVHRSLNPKHILTILNSKNQIIDIRIGGFRSTKSEDLDQLLTCVVDEPLFFDPLAYLEGYDEYSDFWCIGLIMYYIVFEKKITENIGDLKSIRNDPTLLITQIEKSNRENIDKIIIDFISGCLRKKPLKKEENFVFIEQKK